MSSFAARSQQRIRPRREFALVTATLIGYFGLRLVVEGSEQDATRNAERLLQLERWLHVDVEHSVQEWVLHHEAIRIVLSGGYVWLHWPLLIAVMSFLTWRAPEVQVRLRRAIAGSAAFGLFCFATVPMAPPRFMPGYVGTVSDAARRHYLPYPLEWTNQFAAFPSYHIGWTLIACWAVAGLVEWRSLRWPVLRWMMMTPAVIVAIAVVGTGNHYVLDSLVGGLSATAFWVWAGRGAAAGARTESGQGSQCRAPEILISEHDSRPRIGRRHGRDSVRDRSTRGPTGRSSAGIGDLRPPPRPSWARGDRRVRHAHGSERESGRGDR